MALLNELALKMMEYYKNDPARISHFMKVHSYAKLIGEEEKLDKDKLFIAEAAAYVHDIGVKNALAKYNSSVGLLQEKEGPEEARKMLTELEFSEQQIERICYIVGNHHTFDKIDDIDFQIVVEANLIANYYEDNLPIDNILYSYDKIFKTETGKKIMETIYNLA